METKNKRKSHQMHQAIPLDYRPLEGTIWAGIKLPPLREVKHPARQPGGKPVENTMTGKAEALK